ncbi:MAG: DUF4402 domain-containing protein [Labilibaculum sp.]|nr:DUF4402 domain-containing protein [Labilibaculum sp.]
MKKLILSIAAIAMGAFLSNNVMAQTTAVTENTTAGAVLVVPMGITETSALHFGTIIMTDALGGTVTLSTANVRSETGGLALTGITPVSSNAAYNVTGTMNETYALTAPVTITVSETLLGVASMDITNLTVLYNGGIEKPAVNSTSLLSGTGTDNFAIGGLLTVKAAQLAGVYAGTFDVTVDYN